MVLVTHEPRVAAYADREIMLRDGALDPSGLGIPRETRPSLCSGSHSRGRARTRCGSP